MLRETEMDKGCQHIVRMYVPKSTYLLSQAIGARKRKIRSKSAFLVLLFLEEFEFALNLLQQSWTMDDERKEDRYLRAYVRTWKDRVSGPKRLLSSSSWFNCSRSGIWLMRTAWTKGIYLDEGWHRWQTRRWFTFPDRSSCTSCAADPSTIRMTIVAWVDYLLFPSFCLLESMYKHLVLNTFLLK